MPAAEGSYLGFAKQVAAGTPNVTDAQFMYMLFREGGMGVNNISLPLDPEIGGGPLLRSVVKAGASSSGALDIIPRPKSLGLFLLGALGKVASLDTGGAAPYTHTFTFDADPYNIPYFTARQAVNGFTGEQFEDCRVSMLNLNFRAARFLEGAVAFQGSKPSRVSAAAWAPSDKVDGGPQFICSDSGSSIGVEAPGDVDVLAGSFIFTNGIPLDEQFVIGKQFPVGLDVVSRAAIVSLTIKVKDDAFYKKVVYSPNAAAAPTDWEAKVFKDGQFKLEFASDQEVDTGVPYKVTLTANGGVGSAGNVFWSAQPIGLRAGRQVILQVTGVIGAVSAGQPLTVELVNDTPSY